MKKTFLLIISLFVTLSVVVVSCKKEPGSGGNSSIKGNLWQKDCGSSFDNIPPVEHSGADLDIYIIYGNDVSYSDRIRTDYEGDFEFKYLRKGNYKIYYYSMDSTLLTGVPLNTIPPEIAYIKEVEITKGKQNRDIGKMTTFKPK